VLAVLPEARLLDLGRELELNLASRSARDALVDGIAISGALRFRELLEEMDAVVLAADGWFDIAVPPFSVAPAADQKALNAQRADKERVAGASPASASKPAKRRGGGTKPEPTTTRQSTLFGDHDP
jgi:hypothetical protein